MDQRYQIIDKIRDQLGVIDQKMNQITNEIMDQIIGQIIIKERQIMDFLSNFCLIC